MLLPGAPATLPRTPTPLFVTSSSRHEEVFLLLKPKGPHMAAHDLNFLELIQGFRRGELLNDGDKKLTELVEAMQITGSGGDLTLKLKFKVNKAGQFEATPTITIKKPVRALGVGIFFASDEGGLSRRDPNQMDIEDVIVRRRKRDVQ
jgi:hypothetical protein